MTKAWTFLVYIAGDDTQHQAAEETAKKILSCTSSDQIGVAVQLDALGQNTRRYLRTGAAAVNVPTMTMPNVNAGDQSSLTEFLDWGLKNAEGDKVCLLVWGHGAGPQDSPPANVVRRMGRPLARGGELRNNRGGIGLRPVRVDGMAALPRTDLAEFVASDVTSGDFLSNQEFRQALQKCSRHFVDVLAYHACLMGMVEVAYETRDVCRFCVASESETKDSPWPYDDILGKIANSADPKAYSAESLAGDIVGAFEAAAKQDNKEGTLAALRSSKIAALASVVDELGNKLLVELRTAQGTQALRAARGKMISLTIANLVDLGSMFEKLGMVSGSARFQPQLANAKAALEELFVANAIVGVSNQGVSGLGIMFPNRTEARTWLKSYANLEFNKNFGGWLRFLDKFLEEDGLVPVVRLDR